MSTRLPTASPIIPLLEAACGDTRTLPDSLRRFDALASGDGGVDDFEWSARAGETLSPFGATYYFDTGHADGTSTDDVHARFHAITQSFQSFQGFQGFGVERRDGLERLLAGELTRSKDVMQVVLGIDAREAEAQTRIKYYLILRGDPSATVEKVASAFGVAVPPTVDVGLTTILGLDFGGAAHFDLKLYFALDRARMASVLRGTPTARRLVKTSRVIILQQCLVRPRRQLYFHADGPRTLQDELEALEATTPSVRELGRQVRRVRAAGFAIEPWILAHPYANAALNHSTMNVYFHLPKRV